MSVSSKPMQTVPKASSVGCMDAVPQHPSRSPPTAKPPPAPFAALALAPNHADGMDAATKPPAKDFVSVSPKKMQTVSHPNFVNGLGCANTRANDVCFPVTAKHPAPKPEIAQKAMSPITKAAMQTSPVASPVAKNRAANPRPASYTDSAGTTHATTAASSAPARVPLAAPTVDARSSMTRAYNDAAQPSHATANKAHFAAARVSANNKTVPVSPLIQDAQTAISARILDAATQTPSQANALPRKIPTAQTTHPTATHRATSPSASSTDCAKSPISQPIGSLPASPKPQPIAPIARAAKTTQNAHSANVPVSKMQTVATSARNTASAKNQAPPILHAPPPKSNTANKASYVYSLDNAAMKTMLVSQHAMTAPKAPFAFALASATTIAPKKAVYSTTRARGQQAATHVSNLSLVKYLASANKTQTP